MTISELEMETFDEIQVIDEVERLIILRKRLGNIKQYELADRLGVSHSYIGAIENYRAPFTKKLRKKLNKYLEEWAKEKASYGKGINLS